MYSILWNKYYLFNNDPWVYLCYKDHYPDESASCKDRGWYYIIYCVVERAGVMQKVAIWAPKFCFGKKMLMDLDDLFEYNFLIRKQW